MVHYNWISHLAVHKADRISPEYIPNVHKVSAANTQTARKSMCANTQTSSKLANTIKMNLASELCWWAFQQFDKNAPVNV